MAAKVDPAELKLADALSAMGVAEIIARKVSLLLLLFSASLQRQCPAIEGAAGTPLTFCLNLAGGEEGHRAVEVRHPRVWAGVRQRRGGHRRPHERCLHVLVPDRSVRGGAGSG